MATHSFQNRLAYEIHNQWKVTNQGIVYNALYFWAVIWLATRKSKIFRKTCVSSKEEEGADNNYHNLHRINIYNDQLKTFLAPYISGSYHSWSGSWDLLFTNIMHGQTFVSF